MTSCDFFRHPVWPAHPQQQAFHIQPPKPPKYLPRSPTAASALPGLKSLGVTSDTSPPGPVHICKSIGEMLGPAAPETKAVERGARLEAKEAEMRR